MNRRAPTPLTAGFAARIALCAALGWTALAATAQQTAPVKVGVLTDMSSTYSDFGGRGSVVAAQMAIDDFGGQLLGAPVQLVSADHQNKPDVGVTLARRWYDVDGVSAIFDVLNSGLASPLQRLAVEKNRIIVYSGMNNKDVTGKDCSANGFVWGYDSYALASGNVRGVMGSGSFPSWYFVTVDYTSGHTMEADAASVVAAEKGTVAGSVRFPLGSSDFSSFVLRAQASKAKVVAVIAGGSDTRNIMKQAAEFQLSQSGQRVVPLFFTVNDIQGLGLEQTQGLPVVSDFYWDQDDGTRAWSKRFIAKHGKYPTDVQATVYSSVLHYLKAVRKAGSTDTAAVTAAMKELPVDDFMTRGARIRDDGRLMREMHYYEVKAPRDSKYEFDFLRKKATLAPEQAFRPVADSECPRLKKN